MSKNPSNISNIAKSSLAELPESEFNSIIDPKIHSDLEYAANVDILPDPGTPNFSSNSMPPVSPLTPLIGNNFVRLAREEGDPFDADPSSVREMDRLLRELTKQEIEREQLIKESELLKEKYVIDQLIKNVEAGKYNEIKIFFEHNPEYSEYKEIINDLIKAREEQKRNKEEHEKKIAISNTPNRRTRSSVRVKKKGVPRGGKKSKSKKKRLVKTKRKKHKK
tara:strand:+ start:207 stop:872 length:666 start_codon:yes stop_codon:yes gene_type:complete